MEALPLNQSCTVLKFSVTIVMTPEVSLLQANLKQICKHSEVNMSRKVSFPCIQAPLLMEINSPSPQEEDQDKV